MIQNVYHKIGNRCYCAWCMDHIDDILMLNRMLWRKISDGYVDHVMCVNCIESKLGREPNNKDRSMPWWPEDMICDYRIQHNAHCIARLLWLELHKVPPMNLRVQGHWYFSPADWSR